MRVRVYRNLKHGKNAPPLYSIMHKGRVIAHAGRVVLRDVKFIVREGGRQRVLREKRKNVHAFVEGEWVRSGRIRASVYAKRVMYNPYTCGSFTTEDYHSVYSANGVLLDRYGMYALFKY